MFKPMNPDLIRSLLEGHTDVITPEVQKERELFQRLSCPICYEKGCEKRIAAPKIMPGDDGEPTVMNSPFKSGKILAQGYAHCTHCGTDFDPETSVIRGTETTAIAPVDEDPASKIVFQQSEFDLES
jgi:hypothetical protein